MAPRMERRFGQALGAVCVMTLLAALCGSSVAEEVRIEHLGLELLANFETAAGDAAQNAPTVLIVHDALSHPGADAPRALQAALSTRGLPSLAITLSLGIEARRKPFACTLDHDHRDSDAVQEIEAWGHWLVERGAKRLVLVGEGTGALQVAMEAAPTDPAGASESTARPKLPIAGLVLVGPAPSDPAGRATDYRMRFDANLDAMLAEARRIASESGEDTPLDVPGFLVCACARVTAGAILDAYDPARKLELAVLLGRRGLPTLIFLSPSDPRRATFGARTGGKADHFKAEIESLSTAEGTPEGIARPVIAARIATFATDVGR